MRPGGGGGTEPGARVAAVRSEPDRSADVCRGGGRVAGRGGDRELCSRAARHGGRSNGCAAGGLKVKVRVHSSDPSSMFDWSDRYSVGIGSIDAQHQGLFKLAGELYTAMTAGQGNAVSGKVLDRLVRYTATHFAHEERLMRLHGYLNFVEHKEQHDALTARVRQFQADFQQGRATITVQLLQFLKNWLEQH